MKISWRTVSNTMFVCAIILGLSGDGAGSMQGAVFAVLFRMWYWEDLKREAQNAQMREAAD